MADWNRSHIPSQTGKFAIVTGTGGLGYETALALAGVGAHVILAGRNEEKGRTSLRSICQRVPAATIEFEMVDLGSLASIDAFAARMLKRARPVDLLVNNAGAIHPPIRKTTSDGFELQFGTNHLGHFALTGRLLPLLQGHNARVVTVSSLMHRRGSIHFEDLEWTHKYKPSAAYCQSKLANLLFTFELQRRSDANDWHLMCNAAHPGALTADSISNGQGSDTLFKRLNFKFVGLIGHSPAAGALSTLFAATSPDAKPMGYYGPNGFYELKGAVAPAVVSQKARDMAVARRLWEESETLTGVKWPNTPTRPSRGLVMKAL